MKVCTKVFFFCVLLISPFLSLKAEAQQRYWVVFKDKHTFITGPWISSAALQQRTLQQLPLTQFSDLPVHQPYLDSLTARGFTITSVSKWLNAAVVTADAQEALALQKTGFVQQLRPITGYFIPNQTKFTKAQPMSKALAQLKSETIIAAGLTGRGIKVGAIDAGFYKAPQQVGLMPIFEDNRLKAYRDFVNPALNGHFDERESLLDSHGTAVLLCLAGLSSKQQAQSGLATEAEFHLARTDHGSRETRMEEENFIRALEWMDSLGVRLINSSLGYSTGFDNPAENYKPEQMDGSSFIAQAVQMAVEQKGIMLVIAAGNDGGNKKWQIVNTPADAAGVLTVGATNYGTWTKQGYSSIGPDFLPYLKPDVSCFASSGTSFSAPIITGLVACLLEVNPTLTPQQLTQIIRQSSHLYPYGNNYVGYGVPNASKALALAQGKTGTDKEKPMIPVKGDRFSFKPTKKKNIASQGGIVLFRKSSETKVITQQKLSRYSRNIVITRLPGETHTTLQVGSEVMELLWQ